MPLETACLAFAGLSQVARSSARFQHKGSPFWSRGGGATRYSGIALLILSFAVAMWRFGPIKGPVAWTGLLSLSGVVLLLLLSSRPRLALGLTPLALTFALLLCAL